MEFKIKLKSDKDWTVETADAVRRDGDAYIFMRGGLPFRAISASELEGPPIEYVSSPEDEAIWNRVVRDGLMPGVES